MPPALTVADELPPACVPIVKVVPVPINVTTSGVEVELSTIVIDPPRGPSAVGANVTWIVQLWVAGSDVPQLFVWAKSPLTVMLAMFNAVSPLLVSVTDWATLVVPVNCPANVTVVLPRVVAGPIPVP